MFTLGVGETNSCILLTASHGASWTAVASASSEGTIARKTTGVTTPHVSRNEIRASAPPSLTPIRDDSTTLSETVNSAQTPETLRDYKNGSLEEIQQGRNLDFTMAKEKYENQH
jgi:hypothetical protein